MAQFDYSDITYHKSDANHRLIVRGSIRNSSGRNYSAVAIRIILFNKNIALANFIVVINGFPNGVTRRFEKEAEELEYDEAVKMISRYEILMESAY